MSRRISVVKQLAIAVLVLSGVCRAELATGKFTHDMPRDTNMPGTNPTYAELAETFRNPFGKVVTACYWYWINGNVTCEGIRKDLEAMKRVGIERALLGDIGGLAGPHGPVRTLAPEWERALATTFECASRLGIEIGIFNSPGWSQSGGPWVKPEQAMRRLVASSVVVRGPTSDVKLPVPKFERVPADEFQEVVAVAYPAPKDFTARLEVRDENNSLLQRARQPLVVELSSSSPFAAQGAELAFCDGRVSGFTRVEVEQNGVWRKLCEMPFCRMNPEDNVGFAPHAPILVSFPVVTAKKFRVTVIPHHGQGSRYSSIAVVGAPTIAWAYEKSLAKMFESPLPYWHDYLWPNEPASSVATALEPAKAVVLHGKVAKDGTLDWQVPAGEWVIYRFAAAGTGVRNRPANPEATGYEVDKLSRAHIATHFDAYLGKIIERTTPAHRQAIRHAVIDSYEVGGQNYTDDFATRFKASFGYDPTSYFPAVFGMPAASRTDSDRFLWDLRRFVADEVAYSYVGGLRAASNRRGLATWVECYGHWGFPGEFLQYGGQSDGIGGEFWSEGECGNIENRAASSCGHIYGKRQIWAESNTSGGNQFGRSPMDLKLRTDRFFAEGINATVMCLFIHQETDRAPGRIAWFGNEFHRHNSWYDHLDLFIGYIKRVNYLLQQGLNVADVAYFIGEDAPKMTGVTDPAVPRGCEFDYINGEVLRETMGVDAKGRLVLPHGTTYEVLVLPKLETMRPEVLEKLEKLVNAGALVMGPKPLRSPSLAGQPQSDAKVKEIADRLWGEVDGQKVKCACRGKGMIAWGISVEEAMKLRKIEPDVMGDPRHPLIHSHRTLDDAELYFIGGANGAAMEKVEVSFRVAGKVPELWDAATGEMREAGDWRFENGRTVVRISLAERESVMVVFAKAAGNRTGSTRKSPARKAIAVEGPWTLTFQSDALHRGPSQPVKTAQLYDLSTSFDPEVKYYSGKIVYATTFKVAKPGARMVLDLGDVAVTAKVKVNGKYAGGVCFAPYRLDVTQLVKAGENALEVEVCDLWVNRLVGDAELKDRPTWTSLPCQGRGTPLRKAGLIGPVRLLGE